MPEEASLPPKEPAPPTWEAETVSDEEKKDDAKRAFLNEYLVDFNITRAARYIGITMLTARRWLEKDTFRREINRRLEERRKENEALVKKTLEQLLAVMTSDIRDFASWEGKAVTLKDSALLLDSKAIKSVEETSNGIKITLYDKVEAINLMMRGLGMVKKKTVDKPLPEDEMVSEVTGKVSLFDALKKAHQERYSLDKKTQGLITYDKGDEDDKASDSKD